jgi:hypothetical protein
MKLNPIVLICAATFAFLKPTYGDTIKFKADLKPSNEVPPNDSKATGSVALTYNDATKTLTWKGTYSDLTGAPTAAHFHGPAPAGKNASILIPIFVAGSAKSPDSPFEGSAVLTDEQAGYLKSGTLYVNIHTPTNKAGELRGQVVR